MYVRPKIGNTKSGAPQGKSTDVVIFNFAHIDKSKWPKRDANGIKMVGNINFLPGKYIQEIYGTSSTISTPRASEGDEDAVGFTGTPEFSHPGSSLEIEEFIALNTNKQLGVAFLTGGCGGEEPYYKVYGTPCNPLRLVVEGQDNNEAVKDLMKFEQSRKADVLPGRYYGNFTKAIANVVIADATEIDVTLGAGEYQLSDNTSATVITNITNAVDGGVYTLKGSGGSNPATIEVSNANFTLRGVDWQGLANTTLTLVAFDKGNGSFVFFEQSRS
ncbi:hypothetical protein [Tenacibaculum soleae]|uniref:hypothetical protein n=1 Tax=Tenacibaculum soleae TaxID=447689 RepID=UPI002301B653|nr:hypothetical protein [Tenacibaculum soleae]